MHKEQLIERLNNKSAIIGVIGLGYMGLPLSLCFADAGFKVIGFDIDQDKIASLERGESYIEHVASAAINTHLNERFIATCDFSKVSEVDSLILCVPTPLNKNREPDLHFITDTMSTILPYLRKGQVLSLESTTYPGTTEEKIVTPILKRGFVIGEDVFVVYSPEREDPANKDYKTATIPKVCGASTEACLDVGLALYAQAVEKIVPVSSLQAAEMSKLLENIHRAVNIGLVNEMKMVADRMGIDIHEVIGAAATKPFGFVPYYPGPGFGGHCIPIDPFYLTWKAREYGLHTRFIELAGEINTMMPRWVLNKISDGLNQQKKSINGSQVLIAGVAYKKNVDDLRESPALALMTLLQDKGATIEYVDPHVPIFPKMRDYSFAMTSCELTADKLIQFDCVVIITDHDKIDYDFIQQHAPLIVDTRNVYKNTFENVIRA